MSELQQQTDIEQAKNKLQQVEDLKAARSDPRSAEKAQSLPAVPERKPVGDKNIRPVQTKPKKKKFSQNRLNFFFLRFF